MTHAGADISVVICAYTDERWEDLVAAVESVRNQSAAPCEIVIVIDHNPNLLQRAIIQFPDSIVMANSELRGLSGARNTGIAAAHGAVVAFLDEDAVAARDWLAQLSAGYATSRVLGVGGQIEPFWLTSRPLWFPCEFDWVVGCTYLGMPMATAQVRNLIGCNMSFRREVFEQLGGFRHGIGRVGSAPFGCEETEFCIRLRQRWAEGLLIYEPRARVIHRVPESRTQWSYFRSRCYAEGRSKAAISQLVGRKDSLATEWSYVSRTLPRGIIGGIRQVMRERERNGMVRAGAIVAGLTFTTAGYLIGRISERLRISDTIGRRSQLA